MQPGGSFLLIHRLMVFDFGCVDSFVAGSKEGKGKQGNQLKQWMSISSGDGDGEDGDVKCGL